MDTQTITFNHEYNNVGKVQQVNGVDVLYVNSHPCDIDFRYRTQNYVDVAKRKYYVRATNKRYATLQAAVDAVIQSRK